MRRAYFLETAEEKTCQDTERNQPSGARSHTGERRQRGLVRILKETDRVRVVGTHILEDAKGSVRQFMETMCESSKRVAIDPSGRDMLVSIYTLVRGNS